MQMDYPGIRAAVETMMRSGRSIGEVETEVIDPAPLDDEIKAALWLLAWSYLPPRDQREEAQAHLDWITKAGD